jgi:adenosylmethionine-8-amino-7-oxononanoate aminotransferase
MNQLARLDHQFVWHPFTQMKDWLRQDPIVIVEGQGAVLKDSHGRGYLDANSSIWTNLHGHGHPKLNRAIAAQLNKIAHSSALGLANEPASRLAAQLVKACNPPGWRPRTAKGLSKVVYSDDGSTAMEVALKLAYQVARRTGKRPARFVSLERAYHGDTIGAVSLGHIDLFHQSYSELLFPTDKAPAPYCYRCPHNRAKPERADARMGRKCNEECLTDLERTFSKQRKKGNACAGFVFEPLIQGAAGMIAQPEGWLKRAATIARSFGAPLIADEVMTGFGRTGVGKPEARKPTSPASLFACQKEGVQPDYLALAKGMTGGYLPMAATLTTQSVFDAFLGDYSEFKTFFHGHSFTGNQLGAAASLASLDLLQSQGSIRARTVLEKHLENALQTLWSLPQVGDVRRVGLVAGIELVKDWRTREPFDLRDRVGIRVCENMARHGVLTRPIGNVIVIMPPYCTTAAQVARMVEVLHQSISAQLR